MRLAEIAHDENLGRLSLLSRTEAQFDEACRAIESGKWGKAYEILTRLSQDDLPSELADAVRTISGILDPANSLDEKAEKIVQFFTGNVLPCVRRRAWLE